MASDDAPRDGLRRLSRGKFSNRLYAVTTEPSDPDLDPYRRSGEDVERDPLRLVAEAMTRSGGKDLAVDGLDGFEADFEMDL